MKTRPAVYFLGVLKLKGYVEDAGDGLYWFKTDDEVCKRILLVSKDELLIRLK